MCTSCMDEVREKVPSFQKVTLYLRYKPNTNERFRLFEDVTGKRGIRWINLKSFDSIRLVVFTTQQHKTTLLTG